jgi:hypothetical protein
MKFSRYMCTKTYRIFIHIYLDQSEYIWITLCYFFCFEFLEICLKMDRKRYPCSWNCRQVPPNVSSCCSIRWTFINTSNVYCKYWENKNTCLYEYHWQCSKYSITLHLFILSADGYTYSTYINHSCLCIYCNHCRYLYSFFIYVWRNMASCNSCMSARMECLSETITSRRSVDDVSLFVKYDII